MPDIEYYRYIYDFHGLLTARILVSRNARSLTRLEDYYAAYRTSHLEGEADITLKIGAFSPSRPKGSASFDRKTIVGDRYTLYQDTDRVSSWIFEAAEDRAGKITISFSYKGGGIDRLLAPNLFPIAFCMRPLLEARLSALGWGAVHGIGLKPDSGEGVLIVGPGGSGKTTIAIRAILEGGYRYLGDERVLVGDKRMISLFTQPGLFDWKMRNLGQEWISGPARYPAFLRLLWELRSGSKHSDTDFVRECGAESAKLNKVVILRRADASSVRLEEIPSEEAVSSTIWNSYAELINGYAYMTNRAKPNLLKPFASSEMVGEESLFGGHLRRLENILLQSFPNQCYALVVPNDENDWRKILFELMN